MLPSTHGNPTKEGHMNAFLQRHAPVVTGILSGFDRLIFRGYLLRLSQAFYLLGFLRIRNIELKEFGDFAQWCSRRKLAGPPVARWNIWRRPASARMSWRERWPSGRRYARA
jgi:hypothetical protein